MRELTPNFLRECLVCDIATGILTWKERPRDHFATVGQWSRWNNLFAGTEALANVSRNGYKAGTLCRRGILAHRAVWAIVHGDWPPEDIDHINHDRLDNRPANLRCVSRSENARNRTKQRNSTTARTGVQWNRRLGKWCAVGSIYGRTTHLGTFSDFEAACARRKMFEMERGYHPNHGRAAA